MITSSSMLSSIKGKHLHRTLNKTFLLLAVASCGALASSPVLAQVIERAAIAASGTWAATGSMAIPRLSSSTVLLPNGKVLVAGGRNVNPVNTAELYDSDTGLWSPTGAMITAGMYRTTTLLPNGKVLVAGGNSTNGVPSSQST